MKKLIPVILILAAVGIFFGFIDPQYEKLKEDRAQKAEYDRVLGQSKELVSKRNALKEARNLISPADEDRLKKILPDTVDNVRLVLDIDTIARAYGIVISSISIDGDDSGKGDRALARKTQEYGTISVTFGFRADYGIFVRFMRDLEHALRLVDVTSVTVAASDLGQYSYTISLKTYWLR